MPDSLMQVRGCCLDASFRPRGERSCGPEVFIHLVARFILSEEPVDYLFRNRPSLCVVVDGVNVRLELVWSEDLQALQELEQQVHSAQRSVGERGMGCQ